MKAVILAAGVGKRISDITKLPKSLLQINGRTLIENHVRNLLSNGISEVGVVVGYKKEAIINHLTEKFPQNIITFVDNPKYEFASGYSFYLAKDLISQDDVITMDADVYYHPQVLKNLIDSSSPSCVLVGEKENYLGEEYIVTVDQEKNVREFQRAFKQRKYEIVGEWVGFCKFSRADNPVLVQEMERFRGLNDYNIPYEDILENTLKRINAKTVSTDKLPWIEIDFKEDYEKAKNLLF